MANLAVDDATPVAQSERDWASGKLSLPLIWVTPKLTILVTAFASVQVRTVIWSAALIWMGVACLLNSRRCGRVHCRYTGPYYLALILPVLLLGSGLAEIGTGGWIVLGILAVLGGPFITWVTENAWGRYELQRGHGSRNLSEARSETGI